MLAKVVINSQNASISDKKKTPKAYFGVIL